MVDNAEGAVALSDRQRRAHAKTNLGTVPDRYSRVREPTRERTAGDLVGPLLHVVGDRRSPGASGSRVGAAHSAGRVGGAQAILSTSSTFGRSAAHRCRAHLARSLRSSRGSHGRSPDRDRTGGWSKVGNGAWRGQVP